MKKDLIFTPIMLLVGALLFLYKKAQVIEEYKTHFGAGCSKALTCESVCPMKIETITSIMRMNRK